MKHWFTIVNFSTIYQPSILSTEITLRQFLKVCPASPDLDLRNSLRSELILMWFNLIYKCKLVLQSVAQTAFKSMPGFARLEFEKAVFACLILQADFFNPVCSIIKSQNFRFLCKSRCIRHYKFSQITGSVCARVKKVLFE